MDAETDQWWSPGDSSLKGGCSERPLPRSLLCAHRVSAVLLFAPLAPSIHQHQHRSLFGRPHHVLELPLLRVRRIELRGHFRHGLQEPQQETALYRVIRVLRRRPASGQRRPRVGCWRAGVSPRYAAGRGLPALPASGGRARHSVRAVGLETTALRFFLQQIGNAGPTAPRQPLRYPSQAQGGFPAQPPSQLYPLLKGRLFDQCYPCNRNSPISAAPSWVHSSADRAPSFRSKRGRETGWTCCK